MANNLPDLLDRYEEYINKGQEAHRAGHLDKAREYFLLGAEKLFEIASLTPNNELREVRTRQAAEIVDIVEGIDEERTREKQPVEQAEPAQDQQNNEQESDKFAIPSKKPEVSLDDVAGLKDVKQLVREKLIDPFLYPDMAAEFGIKSGGGILLYGPPGTGKTLIAQAVAGEVDAPFYYVPSCDILSKWVGDPEKNVHALFQKAAQNERSVIFFDEIDALASSRQRSEDYMRRVVNQLLSEIQGFDRHENPILVLGATNHPFLVDRAMLRPGRFDELVYIPLPDPEARRHLWEMNLRQHKNTGDFDYSLLVDSSDGYSGAEIQMICHKAAQKAFQRSKSKGDKKGLCMQDLQDVMEIFSPRTLDSDVEELRNFARQYDKNRIINGTEPDDVFDTHPEGRDMEDFLGALLDPFPCDEDLITELAEMLSGRHVGEVCALLTQAVKGHFAERNDGDVEPLTIESFLSLQLNENNPPVAGVGPPGKGEVSQVKIPPESPATGEPDIPPRTEKTAHLSQQAQQVLAAGNEIIDRYKPDLSVMSVQELTARLHEMADAVEAGAAILDVFDAVEFESDVLMATKEPDSPDGDRDHVKFEEADTDDRADASRTEAMKLLGQYRNDLEPDDIKGFSEQIRNSRVVDLTAFKTRLDKIVGSRRRETVEKLLEDRREFLDEGQIKEINEAMSGPDPDLKWIEKYIEDRTSMQKLRLTVRQACRDIDLPRKWAGKVRRMVIREMKRAGELPTVESASSRAKVLAKDVERLARRQQQTTGRLDSPTIDNFESLVIKDMPYDFSDVAGMEYLKDRLESSMAFCLDPEKKRQYEELTGRPPTVAGLLLYGAPGTGKTHVSRCVAGELAARYDLTIINAPVKAIFGQHWSKWLPSVVKIFNLAKSNNPAVIVWDEFDGIGWSPRFGASKHHGKVMNELKAQFSGITAGSETTVHIATTNYPYLLDPPLVRPGRLGEHIHVLPPDFAARREVLEFQLEKGRIAENMDFDRLANLTSGMTMAEIERLLKETADSVAMQGLGPEQHIDMTDLTKMIEKYPPSDFRAWLRGVREKLKQQKFEEPRELLSELYEKDIPRFLDNNEMP